MKILPKFRNWCVREIAALLQAFGLSVGLCGLGNVLQCGLDSEQQY